MERGNHRFQSAQLNLVGLFLACLLCVAFSTSAEDSVTGTDLPLRNLSISVRSNGSGDELDQQRGFSGGIKRDKVLIGTGEPVRTGQEGVTIRHDGLAYNTVNTRRTFSSLSEQNIRAVEGYPAFLYTGQSIKLPSRNTDGDVYTVEAEALQGFYVTARLSGERVILTISTRDDSLVEDEDRDGILIDTQQLSTTVSGRIGEWIDLGGITLSDSSSEDSQVKKTTARSGSIGNIAVKITPLD